MQVGRVYDAACRLLLADQPGIADDVVIPVVAECDDSHLSECWVMQVSDADVAAALAQARASAGGDAAGVALAGSVGAGTGMSCLGFKAGIGSASRITPDGHSVGVLLLTNFGERARLTVAGVPLGRLLDPEDPVPPRPAGSCIGIAVTDAPSDSAACTRLARRIGLGLARTGSTAHHGSGEIFLALATGLRAARGAVPPGVGLSGAALDPLFAAVVGAAEEAVLVSLAASDTVVGRSGHRVPGLSSRDVRRLLAQWSHG